MPEQGDTGQGPGDGEQGSEEEFDRDRAIKTIQAQRESERAAKKEAQEARAEAKALREQIEADKAAREAEAASKLSAEEKSAKKLADMEAKLAESTSAAQTRIAKASLRAAAAGAGAVYPSDVPALIDISKVKFDRDGEPTNVDDLVSDLKDSRPALFGTPKPGSGDGGARGGDSGGKTPDMDDLLRAAAGH